MQVVEGNDTDRWWIATIQTNQMNERMNNEMVKFLNAWFLGISNVHVSKRLIQLNFVRLGELFEEFRLMHLIHTQMDFEYLQKKIRNFEGVFCSQSMNFHSWGLFCKIFLEFWTQRSAWVQSGIFDWLKSFCFYLWKFSYLRIGLAITNSSIFRLNIIAATFCQDHFQSFHYESLIIFMINELRYNSLTVTFRHLLFIQRIRLKM